MRFVLDLDEDDAKLVADALELYTRIGLGQIERVLEHHVGKADPAILEAASDRLKLLLTGFQAGASFSTGSPDLPVRYKRTRELEAELRRELALARPQEGFNIHAEAPLRLTDKPRPRVGKIIKGPPVRHAALAEPIVRSADLTADNEPLKQVAQAAYDSSPGGMIVAIKRVREATGANLRDAKAFCEAHVRIDPARAHAHIWRGDK